MKLSRRFCCVLLCLVMLFGVFLVDGYAAENEIINQYRVTGTADVRIGIGQVRVASIVFYPQDQSNNKQNWIYELSEAERKNTMQSVQTSYQFRYEDGSILFYGGSTYKIKVTNVMERIELWQNGIGITEFKGLLTPVVNLSFIGESGQEYNISGETVVKHDDFYDVSGTFLATENITYVKMVFSWRYDGIVDDTATSWSLVGMLGESGLGQFALSVQKDDSAAEKIEEQNGLIATIIEWLRSIFSSLGSIGDAIASLPAKLWGRIESGIVNLFVPDPTDGVFTGLLASVEQRLAQKLGAVWQVKDLLVMTANIAMEADAQDAIELPDVELQLPDNMVFSLGEHTVQVVPDGFEWLAETCKMITSAVATLAFINGLRKRYEEVIR